MNGIIAKRCNIEIKREQSLFPILRSLEIHNLRTVKDFAAYRQGIQSGEYILAHRGDVGLFIFSARQWRRISSARKQCFGFERIDFDAYTATDPTL